MVSAAVRRERFEIGRNVYGTAAIAFGIVGLLWHDFDTWQQLQSLSKIPLGTFVVDILMFAEILGGIAVQTRFARAGGLVLVVVYSFFALRWIPHLIASPKTYDSWGNVFEQFSLVVGAGVVYANGAVGRSGTPQFARSARMLFGLCVASFTLEQLFYLRDTAAFVPAWLPFGQIFWAELTTVAFALAAIALITGVKALLAARLTTLMIALFGLLVWLPTLIANPHSHVAWGGNAQNWLIGGAAWIVAELLADSEA